MSENGEDWEKNCLKRGKVGNNQEFNLRDVRLRGLSRIQRELSSELLGIYGYEGLKRGFELDTQIPELWCLYS